MFLAMLALQVALIDVCPAFGAPLGGEGYDDQWVEYVLDADAVDAVLNIDAGESFWIGYEAGGFDWPNDVQPVLTLTFDGGQWLDVFWSAQTPGVYYVLPFADPTPRADAFGEHYGTHPCAAVQVDAADYDALIAALRGG